MTQITERLTNTIPWCILFLFSSCFMPMLVWIQTSSTKLSKLSSTIDYLMPNYTISFCIFLSSISFLLPLQITNLIDHIFYTIQKKTNGDEIEKEYTKKFNNRLFY